MLGSAGNVVRFKSREIYKSQDFVRKTWMEETSCNTRI